MKIARKIFWIVFFSLIIWSTTFLFVIPPIGAVPNGATVLMFKPDRIFTNVPFFCSADGLLLDTSGSVSLLGRGMAMMVIMKNGTKIVSLPYSRTAYLISTGGVEFSR